LTPAAGPDFCPLFSPIFVFKKIKPAGTISHSGGRRSGAWPVQTNKQFLELFTGAGIALKKTSH